MSFFAYRYFIELSYVGTSYSGFQIQKNANTIQGEVEKALRVFIKDSFQMICSSRTDAGVHAYQNYFHVDTSCVVTTDIIYHLNAILPTSIVIKNIYQVSLVQHARFDAISREYHYLIHKKKILF